MTDARFAFALVVLLLSGCTYLGLAAPQTFNEKVVVAAKAVTAINDEAAKLVAVGAITPADADNLGAQADLAAETIHLAVTLHLTSPAAGEARLDMALLTLRLGKAYLCAQPRSTGSPLCIEGGINGT